MPDKPTDSKLAAAIARDDAREAGGMHSDDRVTCWTHECWAEDCADDPMHTRPSARHRPRRA
ncbi:hypothetical protein [Embleya sp. NPDC059237]|uniref:hypothetical protein n=1 Tax=Embleya sp. NPDC059237 TaxID=3346784 RepID=UPI0036A58430